MEYIPWAIKFDLIVVYVKHFRAERQQLWVDLTSFLQTVDGPFVVRGDFNSIATTYEYRGATTPYLNSLREFSAFIDDSGFQDLFPVGQLFTWSG